MRPCWPSSRRWRPLRRDALQRTLPAPTCSWLRLSLADAPWAGADPHLSLAALLIELEILDLASTPHGEVTFTPRRDPAAKMRAQRLLALVARHDKHGWPPDAVLRQQVLELRPDPPRRGQRRPASGLVASKAPVVPLGSAPRRGMKS